MIQSSASNPFRLDTKIAWPALDRVADKSILHDYSESIIQNDIG